MLTQSQGSNGTACTFVATEYHYHEYEHFDIEVERFLENEMKDQVKDLLQDFRHFRLNRNSLESHEIQDLESRAKLANDTFQAMFRGLLREEAELLGDSISATLRKVDEWMQQCLEVHVDQGRHRHSNLSIRDCSNLLMQLTSEAVSAEGPATWPWVKKVK